MTLNKVSNTVLKIIVLLELFNIVALVPLLFPYLPLFAFLDNFFYYRAIMI